MEDNIFFVSPELLSFSLPLIILSTHILLTTGIVLQPYGMNCTIFVIINPWVFIVFIFMFLLITGNSEWAFWFIMTAFYCYLFFNFSIVEATDWQVTSQDTYIHCTVTLKALRCFINRRIFLGKYRNLSSILKMNICHWRITQIL